MPAFPRHHAGQHDAGQFDHAGHVGGNHGLPVGDIRLLRLFHTQRQTGIADQNIHVAPFLRQAAGQGRDGVRIVHVQPEGQQVRPQFRRQRIQAFLPAAGCYDAVSIMHKALGNRPAESGGRTGYHCDLLHGLSPSCMSRQPCISGGVRH
ncbi:hypothetical protein GLUCOINTEAF2_0202437 [Komagataeibacter intermedius AF2]|uniref:Uncharacterized protein n=1 Tax=Komagataeibacter intermedius AF2 TaxID=1458464 RepID=A0A0N1N6K7_9PROT|nr:hypothetical protein GLUCOINTEAF2_0202437 [Komagataeibacter intermedius AF2]